MKTKYRLALMVGLAIGCCILIYKVSFQDSKLTYNDYVGHGYQVRKLNQPFSWHDDEESKGIGDEEKGDAEDHKTANQTKKPHICRNSVQGKVLIADDMGHVCQRENVLSTGCCNTDFSTTLRYACQECHQASGCCKVYEHCISCCMDPKKKPVLMNVLNDAKSLKNLLLLSVSDHFELCLAKCRTSSSSVQHENIYINPTNKHCFMKEPTSALGNEVQHNEE